VFEKTREKYVSCQHSTIKAGFSIHGMRVLPNKLLGDTVDQERNITATATASASAAVLSSKNTFFVLCSLGCNTL
jgi:hypothetical protein